MKNSNLRAAMIAGTIALIWSVPSMNIFGIIASILSWVTYSRQTKGTAFTAKGLYIAATVASVLFVLLLVYVGMLIDGKYFVTFYIAAAMISLIGDALYMIAAVMSDKGGKELKESGQEVSGFFE